ncbi:MAG: serine/threonine-protein kinase [Dokdonella sp.]
MSTPRTLKLFEAALDHPSTERADFVSGAASDDPELRDDVLALLAAHTDSAGFLEPQVAAMLPRDLGHYRLIELLGAGGMGQVYLAERQDGAFEQQVAVKVLAATLGDPESVRRAEAERQFLAWLDHPNVARVLDGGTTPEGQPYVVMEYVPGERIDVWCAKQRLDPRARVRLFLQVLAAVDAAHRALIIHRDIKPGNILVTGEGNAKLLDFGIAKSLDDRLGHADTRTGWVPLTPEYASPEQLAGKPLTTACDIYALGVVLYELLTGRAAFERDGQALVAFAQHVASHTPTRPSSRLDAAALNLTAGEVGNWRRRLAGDLDRVVLKALALEPDQRYASATAFADDLRRWLDDRPVVARPASAGYRFAKFVRRNRLPVAAAVVALLALIGGLAIALYQANRANVAAVRAHTINKFLLDMVSSADPYVGGKPPMLVDALDRAETDIPTRFAGEPQLEGDIRLALGSAYLSLERADAARTQLERAVALRTPDGGTDLAAALTSLATTEWTLGHYENAETLYRRAIDIAGSDPNGRGQRAATLNDYSVLLSDIGRYPEALERAQQSQRLRADLPDVPARERALTLGTVAYARHGLGQLHEADADYASSIAQMRALTPQPELSIAIGLNNRAMVLYDLDRLDQAVVLQEQAIALTRKVMGDDYPRLAARLANLAGTYAKLGGHDTAAAAAMAEALTLAPRAFSATDQSLGHLHVTAARVALARNDAATAKAEAEQALAIYAKAEVVEPGRREKAQDMLAAASKALIEKSQ